MVCSYDNCEIAEKILGRGEALGEYLSRYLSDRSDFGMRCFYGEAFTLAFLNRLGRLSTSVEKKLQVAINTKDTSAPQYHWEFNNYALLEAGRLTLPLRFNNTSCTNWTLLRSRVRLGAGVDAVPAMEEAAAKLRNMQKRSGLILDDSRVKSFQYHCFSAAMLFEIYEINGDERFRLAFERAVAFIRHFILPNGDTLYVGRGQQQCFGYASLLYVLCVYYALTGDCSALGDIVRVYGFVQEHARPDGSLPLVLGGGSEPLPHSDAPHRAIDYPGWYSYNNHFDYQPFAGLFLLKAADVLRTATRGNAVFEEPAPYRDRDFRKYVAGDTVAVVSRPGGYWSNDLPVPYVFARGKARMPCYGGEQFFPGLYSELGIPLPVAGGKSMREFAKSLFVGEALVVVSPLGILIRRYDVEPDLITIKSVVLSPRHLCDRYLFLPDRPKIRSQYDLKRTGVAYSASGVLHAYEAEGVGIVVLEFSE